jgi:hypothetical protein
MQTVRPVQQVVQLLLLLLLVVVVEQLLLRATSQRVISKTSLEASTQQLAGTSYSQLLQLQLRNLRQAQLGLWERRLVWQLASRQLGRAGVRSLQGGLAGSCLQEWLPCGSMGRVRMGQLLLLLLLLLLLWEMERKLLGAGVLLGLLCKRRIWWLRHLQRQQMRILTEWRLRSFDCQLN